MITEVEQQEQIENLSTPMRAVDGMTLLTLHLNMALLNLRGLKTLTEEMLSLIDRHEEMLRLIDRHEEMLRTTSHHEEILRTISRHE
jgi:hypothetical protein